MDEMEHVEDEVEDLVEEEMAAERASGLSMSSHCARKRSVNNHLVLLQPQLQLQLQLQCLQSCVQLKR